MTATALYLATGGLLFVAGLVGTLLPRPILRRVLALNLMGSGVFLVLVATAARNPEEPQAAGRWLVLAGIAVAFAVTAMVLHLLLRLRDDGDGESV